MTWDEKKLVAERDQVIMDRCKTNSILERERLNRRLNELNKILGL